MMRALRKVPNWKPPGPDDVKGYWLKNLTLLHNKLLVYLQDCRDPTCLQKTNCADTKG